MKKFKRNLALALIVVLAVGLFAGCGEQAQDTTTPPEETEAADQSGGDGGGIRIGVCNAYIGNAWRAQMLEGLDLATEELKAAGLVEDVQVVSTNNDVTE